MSALQSTQVESQKCFADFQPREYLKASPILGPDCPRLHQLLQDQTVDIFLVAVKLVLDVHGARYVSALSSPNIIKTDFFSSISGLAIKSLASLANAMAFLGNWITCSTTSPRHCKNVFIKREARVCSFVTVFSSHWLMWLRYGFFGQHLKTTLHLTCFIFILGWQLHMHCSGGLSWPAEALEQRSSWKEEQKEEGAECWSHKFYSKLQCCAQQIRIDLSDLVWYCGECVKGDRSGQVVILRSAQVFSNPVERDKVTLGHWSGTLFGHGFSSRVHSSGLGLELPVHSLGAEWGPEEEIWIPECSEALITGMI